MFHEKTQHCVYNLLVSALFSELIYLWFSTSKFALCSRQNWVCKQYSLNKSTHRTDVFSSLFTTTYIRV